MRFFIINLGCPKNLVDSEGMAALLQAAGHRPASAPRHADLIIVNTCGFIAAARAESLATLRQAAQDKRPGQMLVAAGCLAEREGAGLARRVPGIDACIGTRHWSQIVPLVDQIVHRTGSLPVLLQDPGPGDTVAPCERTASGPTAYLKIADGCDAACAFCAIPAIKGPQRSKPREAILAEARALVDRGARELILIAQDTTAYGRDRGERRGLASLIRDLLREVPELVWLRLMYAYPQHVDGRLIDLLASDPRICHYLDLPLQHAHPDVLRRMRRPHDVEEVVRLVERLRAAIPDIALRTAFIVGFPGETEPEFEALLQFLEAMRFDRVGIFTYSKERGTPAAALPGHLPPTIRRERYERAMALQQRISLERNRAQVGRSLLVLTEGSQNGITAGRCYRDAPEVDGLVLVRGAYPEGQFLPVTVTEALEYDLVGTPTGEPGQQAGRLSVVQPEDRPGGTVQGQP
ncbi:MAG: 30S ribosomal protein S12 methylthiotransferase RimO [Anaerolineae bacterium]|nr:30S ribosomal protein S12 methylthiotransferase RimO [Anaerolineae bacterium]